MRCRFPSCYNMRIQRWGLCNKHRKWVEKGNMTQDLVIIKPIQVRGGTCKVEECEEKTRRHGFCERHSWAYKRGALLSDGTQNPNIRRVRYARDFPCFVCGKKGKITKGFCPTHYNQYRKGIIDFEGRETGKRIRIWKYGELDICKVVGCGKRPRGNGFCKKHIDSHVRGVYDFHGNRLKPRLFKNQGKVCKVCQKPAYCKLLCRTHYARHILKKPLVKEIKNKGKTCKFGVDKTTGCNKPARCRGLCSIHYYRYKKGLAMDYERPVKIKHCLQCETGVAAFSKGLCKKHYSRIRYENVRAAKSGRLKTSFILPLQHTASPHLMN